MNKQGKQTFYVPRRLRERWEQFKSEFNEDNFVRQTFSGEKPTTLIEHILSLKDGKTGLNKEQKRTIRGLIDFLNELKATFFTTEAKFKRFMELLERHVSLQELANLEAMLK